MLVGKPRVGFSPVALPTATKRVSRFVVPGGGRISKLAAYLDGLGGAAAALTVSGNELTDAARANYALLSTASAGVMVDGLLGDASFGIRRAATNLFRRGQADTAADRVAVGTGVVTVAVDATVRAPASPQSIAVSCDGSVAGQGYYAKTASGQAAAVGTKGVGSLYFRGTAGLSYTARVRWRSADTSLNGQGATTTFSASGGWQLVVPALATVAGVAGDQLEITVFTASARTERFWVAHEMLESGQPVVAPYVTTSAGATATHGGGRVQFPVSATGVAQGWVAVRKRVGWASSAPPADPVYDFLARVDSSNFVAGRFTGGAVEVVRSVSGSATTLDASASWAAGAFVTTIYAWDAGSIYVSVGGASFTSVAAAAGAGSLASFDIGSSQGTSGWGDSEFLWAVAGVGALTDIDVAAIAALSEPTPFDFERDALVTAVATFDDPYYFAPVTPGTPALIRPVIYDTSGVLVAEGDELQVPAGDAPTWRALTFGGYPGGVVVAAGSYDFGFHAGGAASARAWRDPVDAPGGQWNIDVYDGASPSFGSSSLTSGRMSVFAATFAAWVAPAELEVWYGRLPWEASQAVFALTAARPETQQDAVVEWHGTLAHAERGAFAAAQVGGKFEDLIGERVRVTVRGQTSTDRAVYVYVNDLAEIDGDLSLPRRAFLALAPLGLDSIEATVETLA